MSRGKIFHKNYLQVGDVVQFRNGTYAMVYKTIYKDLVFYQDNGIVISVSNYHDNLICKIHKMPNGTGYDYDVIRVFGLSELAIFCHTISPKNRKLLWERKVLELNSQKQMTVKEIEKTVRIQS